MFGLFGVSGISGISGISDVSGVSCVFSGLKNAMMSPALMVLAGTFSTVIRSPCLMVGAIESPKTVRGVILPTLGSVGRLFFFCFDAFHIVPV